MGTSWLPVVFLFLSSVFFIYSENRCSLLRELVDHNYLENSNLVDFSPWRQDSCHLSNYAYNCFRVKSTFKMRDTESRQSMTVNCVLQGTLLPRGSMTSVWSRDACIQNPLACKCLYTIGGLFDFSFVGWQRKNFSKICRLNKIWREYSKPIWLNIRYGTVTPGVNLFVKGTTYIALAHALHGLISLSNWVLRPFIGYF